MLFDEMFRKRNRREAKRLGYADAMQCKLFLSLSLARWYFRLFFFFRITRDDIFLLSNTSLRVWISGVMVQQHDINSSPMPPLQLLIKSDIIPIISGFDLHSNASFIQLYSLPSPHSSPISPHQPSP